MRPPDGRQPRRSPDRPASSRPEATTDDTDDGRLAPREQARIDGAVVTVAPRGSGPVFVAVLVVAAFLLGLVRPWDWLGDEEQVGPAPGIGEATSEVPGRDGASPAVSGSGEPDTTQPVAIPPRATCGYPSSWRTSSISFWAGARARVWTAAEAVPASGPADPAIPFHVVASDTVEAIGWCAPVTGSERPPLAAEASLYRIRDGAAVEVPSDRLEPAEGDALGELRVPRLLALGRRQLWAPGRYVIRLATPSGTYERFLGIEVGVRPRAAATAPVAEESGGPADGASPSRPGDGASPVSGASPSPDGSPPA